MRIKLPRQAKAMPPKKELKCSCNGTILNAKRGKYCAHLEKRLPRPSKASIKAELLEEGVENIAGNAPWIGRSYSEEEIRAYLTDFNLEPLEVQIVFLYVYKQFTFEAIAEVLGLPGPSSAEYRLKKIFKRIKKEYEV